MQLRTSSPKFSAFDSIPMYDSWTIPDFHHLYFCFHKWKFEDRKRYLNCKYSPTENSMSWLSGLQILFSYRGTPVHKPEFWSSLLIWDNDIAVFDTGTHLRQPWLSTHRLWLAPDTNASTGFHPDGSGWHSVISQLEEQYQLHQNWNSVSGLERFTAVNIQNWQYPNIRQRKMVTA